MAKFDYIRMQNLAQRLIDKFGQGVPLVRVSTTYNAVTGLQVLDSYSLLIATVVSLPISGALTVQGFDNSFREDLKAGKIRGFYIAAKDLDWEPKGGDMIVFEGGLWNIAGATPLNPAGTHVLSTVGCREGSKEAFGDALQLIVDSEGITQPADVTDPANLVNEIIALIRAENEADHAEIFERLDAVELDNEDDVESGNINW